MKSSLRIFLAVSVALLLALTLILGGCAKDVPPAGSENDSVSDTESTPDMGSDSTSDTSAEADSDTVTETEAETDARIELVQPDENKVPDMAVTDQGYDIYRLTEGREWGYRYGCTYLYNDDGSVDAYFACVGQNTGEWDWIAYRHSPDGGESWEPEKIVLTPTQGSMDFYSNCDPGVVYFGGYYYLGYTSTLNDKGFCNNLFVARSQNPDGPFEKWNGSGWGGYEPQPIVYYDENYEKWGIGEPSFVELNGTLYLYYTHSGAAGEYTMVATADATNENWPETMKFHGSACQKNTDSLDVKYVEEWGKFVGVATGDRMGPSSWLGVYESNDGIHFELVDITREGTYSHLHNAGLSSRRNGHIRLSEDADKLCVIYAYGEGWGTWNTRIQPISLALSDGNDMDAERAKPCLADEHLRDAPIPEEERHVAMVRPAKDVYTYSKDKGSFLIQLNVFDTYFDKTTLRRTEIGQVTFRVYDESVITIEEQRATIVGVGMTPVEVHYQGCVYLFHVVITEEPVNTGSGSTPVRLDPAVEEFTLYLGERAIHRVQLRARMWWADGTFTEFFCNDDDTNFGATYTGYDEAIISVSDKGIVTPKATGATTVTVTCMGLTCQIRITVTDDPQDGYYQLQDLVIVDYGQLDFSVAGTEKILTGIHSAQLSHDAEEGALKAVVTGEDAIFCIPFSLSPDVFSADEYGTLTITYRVDPGNSSKAINLQVFLCVGDITEPNASYQSMQPIKRDGEYHTLTVKLSAFSWWAGDIHTIRVDFFDQSSPGDTMYIKSIELSQ